MSTEARSWRRRLGLERDVRERREVVERSRRAIWRVPIALIVARLVPDGIGTNSCQRIALPRDSTPPLS